MQNVLITSTRYVLARKQFNAVVYSLRWLKPPWAAIAGTKLFKVRTSQPPDPEFSEELKMRWNEYNVLMHSIRSFLAEEQNAQLTAQSQHEYLDREKQHVEKCAATINEFNKKSTELRNLREITEKKEVEEEMLNRFLQIESEEQARVDAARAQVVQTIHDSEKFISLKDLDSAIEQALNTKHVYNFVIDSNGRKYVEQTDGSCVAEGDSNVKL